MKSRDVCLSAWSSRQMESQDYSPLALRIVLSHRHRWDGGGSRDRSGLFLFKTKFKFLNIPIIIYGSAHTLYCNVTIHLICVVIIRLTSFNNFAELLPGTVNHSLELVTQDISKFECSGTQPCIDSKLWGKRSLYSSAAEHWSCKPGVVSSILTGGTSKRLLLFWLI